MISRCNLVAAAIVESFRNVVLVDNVVFTRVLSNNNARHHVDDSFFTSSFKSVPLRLHKIEFPCHNYYYRDDCTEFATNPRSSKIPRWLTSTDVFEICSPPERDPSGGNENAAEERGGTGAIKCVRYER